MNGSLRLMFVLPLLWCAVAATAIAQGVAQTRETHRQDDRMAWRQDDQQLRLHGSAQGVQVEAANTLRLHDGDTLIALDGQPIHTPQALLDGLRRRQGHSVALEVRGADGVVRTVRWSPGEYADLLPTPPPPPPPLAPPPPPPPQP